METFFRLVHHGIRGKRTVPQLNGDGPIVDSSEVQQTTTVHSHLPVPQLNGDGPIVDSSEVQQTTTVHSHLPVPQSNDGLHSASYFSLPNGENVTSDCVAYIWVWSILSFFSHFYCKTLSVRCL